MLDISDFQSMPAEPNRPNFISTETREGRYFFLDLNPPRGRPLSLVCAGREICTPAYRIERRNFEYHVIEFVVSGTWKLECGGRSEELRAGALFAYGPGDAYSLEAGRGGELIKYFATFTGRDAGVLLDECGLSGARVRYVPQVRWIHDLFEQLLDCAGLEPELAREIGNRLNELILLRARGDSLACDARQSDSLQTFARCRTTIQEHYLELSSVEAIAVRCHVNPAYLARLFKRFGSERPLQLLTRLKTNHAADLILRMGYNVTQAGNAVGFADPYHFSRVFKRTHGVPPGNLRLGSQPVDP